MGREEAGAPPARPARARQCHWRPEAFDLSDPPLGSRADAPPFDLAWVQAARSLARASTLSRNALSKLVGRLDRFAAGRKTRVAHSDPTPDPSTTKSNGKSNQKSNAESDARLSTESVDVGTAPATETRISWSNGSYGGDFSCASPDSSPLNAADAAADASDGASDAAATGADGAAFALPGFVLPDSSAGPGDAAAGGEAPAAASHPNHVGKPGAAGPVSESLASGGPGPFAKWLGRVSHVARESQQGDFRLLHISTRHGSAQGSGEAAPVSDAALMAGSALVFAQASAIARSRRHRCDGLG